MDDTFKSSSILICDDSPTFTTMLAAILKDDGCEDVITLNDPRDVMATLATRTFDLLLLDIMMPYLDGVEVTHLVRQRFSPPELPILVLTGSQDTAIRNRALDMGANDYLHKPIDPVEVSLRARNLLAIRQSYKNQLAYSELLEAEVAARTAKLNMLVENGLMLSGERKREKLLEAILLGGQRLSHCDAATLYLLTEENTLRFAMRTLKDQLPSKDIPLYDPITQQPNLHFVSTWVALNNTSINIEDVYQETRFDLSGTRAFDAQTQHRTISMLTVPLSPRGGDVLGVLQFMNAMDPETGKIIPFAPGIAHFLEALAAQAAVALDLNYLVDSQTKLIDGIIKVLASSIDARSAHTGRHCQRMPELAEMLAEAASQVEDGALAGFGFSSDEEWREFRIAAWLHDCGKITTPDHIVDKSTKLDVFYNRIHEIRTRFEVLLRDAMIARLEALASGTPQHEADAQFAQHKARLIEDFQFVAQSNLGQEAMSPEHQARLARIGKTVWLRHFDDHIGLSQNEIQRRRQHPAAELPAKEHLLSDQPWHVIPRETQDWPAPHDGFKLKVPDNLYHHGELYNLSIGRGTLTEEERYKINDHIVQTIVMLEKLPFPKSLRHVPEYAGAHHETLTGTGYPRQLDAKALATPSRILAIADIFEALTASDRPYKHGKTISESLRILGMLAKQGQIDPHLFNLLIQSDVLKRYAKLFLKPEQIDGDDFSRFTVQTA